MLTRIKEEFQLITIGHAMDSFLSNIKFDGSDRELASKKTKWSVKMRICNGTKQVFFEVCDFEYHFYQDFWY